MLVVTAISLVLACVFGFFVIRSAFRPENSDREKYAFRCLTVISSLAVLAIANISSKQGISDQLIALVAIALGHPLPDAPPAPFSEKMLVVLLIAFIIYLIFRSHKNWKGDISAEEADRLRMKREISLLNQAYSEIIRLSKRQPPRQKYTESKRLDSVSIPGEINLVWHEHARELFELNFSTVRFDGETPSGWDHRSKTWRGHDRSRRETVFVFCPSAKPSNNDVEELLTYISKYTESQERISIFCVFRGEHESGNSFEYRGVRFFSEDYLFENSAEFSDYFADIVRRVEKDCLPGSNVTIRQLYTPSSIATKPSGEGLVSEDLGSYLSDWSKRPAGQHVAILGEYGQGKSTGALFYVYEAIKSNLSLTDGRIPLLIELRGKSPANLAPQELLAAWAQQYKIHASALMKLLIDGRLILILEGFDEMANVSSAESRVSHFRALWRLAFPKNKIIFTGRRNFFFEDQELNIVFRGRAEDTQSAICQVLHLCPFDYQKIQRSLRWTSQSVASEIVAAGKSNLALFDIIARPALLYIVATLWDEFRPLLSQGGLTSAQVIDRFIQHSYDRQEAKEPDLNFMALTTTERRYFYEGIAVFMASRDGTNQIVIADLRAAIERLYNAYPDDAHISDAVFLETDQSPLKRRSHEPEVAVEAVMTDVRTHGILVNDLGQRGAFKFAHKSFYELLCAKVHANWLLKIEPIFYRSIKSAMDGSIEHASKSPEILKFFAEIIHKHLREKNKVEDIALPALDLISGQSDRFWQKKLRPLDFVALKIALNSQILQAIGALAMMTSLLSSVLRSQWSQQFSFAGINELRFFFSSSIAELAGLALGPWTLIVVGFFYFVVIAYSIYTSRYFLKCVRLWAAVLMVMDQTLRLDTGRKALRRYLGKKSSDALIESVSKRYELDVPKKSP
ncbi:hypothetical protein FEE59_16250 [Herbaspirillum sp. RU 5E]|nr:hypothetical protein [Herbaspirillum sp. RU 5E]